MALQFTSESINNYNYAPGTATYGGQGLPGTPGADGNCIFFTTYNVIGGEDMYAFRQALRENRLPIRNGIVIPRKFKNGDYFFDRLGNILELTDIDSLMSFPALTENYNLYFKLVGRIRPASTQDNIFTKTENSSRVSLNSEYTGVDINNSDLDIDNSGDDTNYALRLIGGSLTGDNVEVLHCTAFHNYNRMSDLKIYYNTVDNIWHIDSEVPIVIDSEVKVNDDADELISLDNYSSVITSKTPITVFYNIAQNITWEPTQGYYIKLNGIENIPAEMKNFIQVKIVTNDGQTIFKTIDNVTERFNTLNSKFQTVSLIYNIEVYLRRVTAKKKDVTSSGIVKVVPK